jgi:DNA-nicking Smr family endonuclease
VFTPFLPKNEKEEIELVNLSTNGVKTMSQRTAMKKNPLVDNPQEEEKLLQEEQERELETQMQMMGQGDTVGANSTGED